MRDVASLRHDGAMRVRTVVDLPEDLHRLIAIAARASDSSVSDTIARLLRAVLGAPGSVRVTTSARTGLRVASLGRLVTSEDVRPLDDD
jgi:hypothetical protein